MCMPKNSVFLGVHNMHTHIYAMTYTQTRWHNAGMLAGPCLVNKDGMSDPLSHCCSPHRCSISGAKSGSFKTPFSSVHGSSTLQKQRLKTVGNCLICKSFWYSWLKHPTSVWKQMISLIWKKASSSWKKHHQPSSREHIIISIQHYLIFFF